MTDITGARITIVFISIFLMTPLTKWNIDDKYDRPTFLLGWIDTLVEAPVLTPTGNLDNVELTHNSITLGVMKRQFKTKFWHIILDIQCMWHAVYLTIWRFSTSIKTSVPLVLLSRMCCGWILLRQADACRLRDRLAQMNTVWRNTRWLHMKHKEKE